MVIFNSFVVTKAVFLVVGIICVSGTVIRGNFRVVFRTLRSIFYNQGDGGSCGHAFKDTREDFDFVIFFAGGGKAGLPRFSAV